MAISEQKTGFRLPWASEPRINTLADEADPEPPEASIEATHTEDTVTQDTGTATIDPRSSISWPTMDGTSESAPEATADAGAEYAEPTDAVAPSGPAAAAAPVKARRDNPLVAGLVRAMRDAAQSAQEESLTRFAEAAKARIEGIHTESGENAASIRQQSDQDIAGIREWSKAEMARIREETDERIADRKRKLEIEVDEHGARVEHRIELVKKAVATFESEMEQFFKTLLAEDDPTKLAGYAEQLPEPPSLEGDFDAGTWAPARTLDADNAAAAEAELMADLGVADVDENETTEDNGAKGMIETAAVVETEADVVEPEATSGNELTSLYQAPETDEPAVAEAEPIEPVAEAEPVVEAAEATADPVTESDDAAVERLATFTDPASGREPRTSTRVSVVGLVSVASIAGFKRAVGRTPGVSGVSVASGPNGDFVFTVQHAASTDLRTLIPELDGFAASITGDADGVLTVSASEPAEAK